MIKLTSRKSRLLVASVATAAIVGGLFVFRSGVAEPARSARAEQQSVVALKQKAAVSSSKKVDKSKEDAKQASSKSASSTKRPEKASSSEKPQAQPTATTAVAQPAARPVATATRPATVTPRRVSAPVQRAPQYAASTLYFAGTAVRYIIGNQSMGAAPAYTASTWGGVTNYSHTSGANTHFIGHSPGVFAPFLSMGVGSRITVTDRAGTPKTYTVYAVVSVNDNAVAADGTDYWDAITGTGGGQRITIQTCISETQNRILFAR